MELPILLLAEAAGVWRSAAALLSQASIADRDQDEEDIHEHKQHHITTCGMCREPGGGLPGHGSLSMLRFLPAELPCTGHSQPELDLLVLLVQAYGELRAGR